MAIKSVLLFCFILSCSISTAQIDDNVIRIQVLENNKVNKKYTFGNWTENGGVQTDLIYLGFATAAKGRIFKILTSVWHWGQSHHTTSKILIYNDQNQYLGEYNVGAIYDLPNELKNGVLCFYHDKTDNCDQDDHTYVDLKKRLPHKFFLKCKGSYGDIYSFYSQ